MSLCTCVCDCAHVGYVDAVHMCSSLSEVCALRPARYWSNKQTGDSTKPGIRCRNHSCAINDIEMSTTRAALSNPRLTEPAGALTPNAKRHFFSRRSQSGPRWRDEPSRKRSGWWGGEVGGWGVASLLTRPPPVLMWWCKLCVCTKDPTGRCSPPKTLQ